MELNWVDGFVIKTAVENGTIVLSANKYDPLYDDAARELTAPVLLFCPLDSESGDSYNNKC